MPISLAMQLGGHADIAAGAGTTTLAYGPLRRLQLITSSVALADVRLPDSSGPEFPVDVGLYAFVVVNVSPSNSVRLRDFEGNIDVTLAPDEAAIVPRFYD